MNYRDLREKQIGLIGPEKICKDIEEFFNELTFKHIIYETSLSVDIMSQVQDCNCIIVGFMQEDIKYHIIKESVSVVLLLNDIYRMVDEFETFYIDKRFHEKTICVYGDKSRISSLVVNNPNLKIDYILEDQITNEHSMPRIVAADKVKELTNPFVIIADQVCEKEKRYFMDLGLEFGKDFHFYNDRVPKHSTSYYLNKTLMDLPKYTIPCDYTTKALSIKAHGNVMACCSSVGLSMGNFLYTSIEEVLKGVPAQLIRLSVSNRTYSFCNDMCFMFREEKYQLNAEKEIKANLRKDICLKEIKDFNVQLGYDRSCNLACRSCRNHRITKPEDDTETVEMMHEEVKRMCFKKPRNMRIGNGELFFSPYYKDIIFNHYESDNIALISNGMLFTPENWSFLEKRYQNISLEVSIDSVNPDTYKKLRGGDLHKLRKNMEFASQLRKQNKLKKLSISFVIQDDNYKEMIDFVEYGKSIHADFIHFMKLNSWGHIPSEEFIKMDVYDERNVHHKDFINIIKNPIFLESNIHIDNIENFIGRKRKMTELIPTMDNFKEMSKKMETVIFCAGEYCMRFLNRLDDEELKHISFIVDNDTDKQGRKIYGISVKNPEEIKWLSPDNTLVVIAVENGIPEIYEQICNMGAYNIMSARILINDILSQVAVELIRNKSKIDEAASLLCDDKSKWIYNEVIKRRTLYGECDFSDLIVRGNAEYRTSFWYENECPKDEIVIDCGAYNGDTLKKFAETYGPRLKKIYLFECMEESITDLTHTMTHMKNKKYYPEMVLMPYALSDHECVMKFAKTNKSNGSFLVDNRGFAQSALYESDYVDVNVTTLDKVIPSDERITFIKMDIEGSEYPALYGAERIIKTNKPRLAISIYHCGEDYYRIPLLLKRFVPEYRFAVRHHKKNHVDTDLYCWIED